MTLITTALVINILVAGYWGMVLAFFNTKAAVTGFGEDTPARRILACLYLSIACTSCLALFLPGAQLLIVSVLFPVQILYKVLSVFVVRNISNPVVVSNIIISFVLLLCLYSIFN